jgi:hypothetical protein
MQTRDVKHEVFMAARMFAFLHYQDRNPQASADLKHTFAERAWPRFVDMATDFVTLREALRRQEAAAPLN